MGLRKSLLALLALGTFFSAEAPVSNISYELRVVDKPTFIFAAGHSDVFPGKHHRGIAEEEYVLDMVLQFGGLFDSREYNIIYTRTDGTPLNSEGNKEDLEAKAQLAIDVRPDIYFGFHLNYSKKRRLRNKDNIELLVLGMKGYREMNDGRDQEYKMKDFGMNPKRDIYSQNSFDFAADLEDHIESTTPLEVQVKAKSLRELSQHPVLLGSDAKQKVRALPNNDEIELPTVALIIEFYWLQNRKHRDSIRARNYGRMKPIYEYLRMNYRAKYELVPIERTFDNLKDIITNQDTITTPLIMEK